MPEFKAPAMALFIAIMLFCFPLVAVGGASAVAAAENYAHQKLLELTGDEFVDYTGDQISADRIREVPRVILLFTASWCGPCRAVMPDLEDFYQKYREQDQFEFLMVSRDHSKEAMHSYMKDYEMPWPAIPYEKIKQSGLSKKYNVRGIPHLIVLDASGELITRGHPASLLSRLEDRFIDKSDTKESKKPVVEFSNIRFIRSSLSTLELIVDYEFNISREKSAVLAVYPLKDGRRSTIFGYSPARLSPEGGTANVNISYKTYDPHYEKKQNHKPESITTDGFLLRVREKTSEGWNYIHKQRIEGKVKWIIEQVGESEAKYPSDTEVNSFSNARIEKIDNTSVKIIADYEYRSDHGDFVSASAAFGRDKDFSHPYVPGDIQRGSGTTEFRLNGLTEEVVNTDYVHLEMYIPQERTFYTQNLPYEYDWSKLGFTVPDSEE
jgi:thiol-disulfide isomerase/thioredoxin